MFNFNNIGVIDVKKQVPQVEHMIGAWEKQQKPRKKAFTFSKENLRTLYNMPDTPETLIEKVSIMITFL